MKPSPALWNPVLMEHHHAWPCTTQVPPSTRPSNWRTDCDQTRMLGKLPSKLLPGEYKAATTPAGTKIRQGAIRSQALHASTTILCKNPCSMLVSHLPLVYKRRRRMPDCRGIIFTRIHLRTFAPLILTLASIDLEASPPLPSACSPPLQAPQCTAIQRHERNLLDVRPCGRNQD
jgi:hypothetical protein